MFLCMMKVLTHYCNDLLANNLKLPCSQNGAHISLLDARDELAPCKIELKGKLDYLDTILVSKPVIPDQ